MADIRSFADSYQSQVDERRQLGVPPLPLDKELTERLAGLRSERVRSSREFFQQNADKFHAQQDLIASYEQYADTVADTLDQAALPQRQLVLATEAALADGQAVRLADHAYRVVVERVEDLAP